MELDKRYIYLIVGLTIIIIGISAFYIFEPTNRIIEVTENLPPGQTKTLSYKKYMSRVKVGIMTNTECRVGIVLDGIPVYQHDGIQFFYDEYIGFGKHTLQILISNLSYYNLQATGQIWIPFL